MTFGKDRGNGYFKFCHMSIFANIKLFHATKLVNIMPLMQYQPRYFELPILCFCGKLEVNYICLAFHWTK